MVVAGFYQSSNATSPRRFRSISSGRSPDSQHGIINAFPRKRSDVNAKNADYSGGTVPDSHRFPYSLCTAEHLKSYLIRVHRI